MAFPFGEKSPKKDIRRVIMDIVTTSSKEEMKLLFAYLEKEEVKNVFDIQPDDYPSHTFHVDLYDKRDKSFSILGLHVKAEQAYHGAKVFEDVETFIAYRSSLRLN